MNSNEIPSWARKAIADQQVIINDMRETVAGIEIARAQRESAEKKPAKQVLQDNEVSPWVKEVIDEMTTGKKPLPEGTSGMMKDVLNQREKETL